VNNLKIKRNRGEHEQRRGENRKIRTEEKMEERIE
jgi:hypothetical protein